MKKGFLLASETLKIVIAVICIGFLAYFLATLYFASVQKENYQQAQETMEKISQTIAASGGTVYGVTPTGWTVFGFTEDKKPNSCAAQNCICICKKQPINLFDQQIKSCDEKGVCLIVQDLEPFESIKIIKAKEGTTDINVVVETGGVRLE